MSDKCRFSRVWAMPNSETFAITVIGDWVKSFLQHSKVSIDPFARNRRWATHTNDLNPDTAAESHLEARDFLRQLVQRQVVANLIIFDPPYSPRQVQECYESIGRQVTMQDTQTAVLKAECQELFRHLTYHGSVVLSFGWNTVGMGPGWTMEQLMLVSHGGDHNDTICMAERRDLEAQSSLFATQGPL